MMAPDPYRGPPVHAPGSRRLCRACGRAFAPSASTTREGVSIACDAEPCRLWAARYHEGLELGTELPPEYGMQALPDPRPITAPMRVTTREFRREARRVEAQARANERRRAREADVRGVETVWL